ncbi:MAG TPA: GNAT family N-acetyltransferase [Candidatus Binatia bacterium]|nr:GNAT family N-acetyltransferase [Candidatus Binatia bacterium]
MDHGETVVRPAKRGDREALGRLGALLVGTHHGFDRDRFMAPGADVERGYGWFLGTQLREDDAAVFVAEQDGEVVGYVYAGLEPRSWKELRDAAGFVHDVVVDERARRSGVARALLERAIEWLRERGAPRVMLWTAEQNRGAQELFAELGFRRTMIEMTRELSDGSPPRGERPKPRRR